MNKALSILIFGSILLVACGIYWPVSMPPRGMGPVSYWDHASNGEQIYFTATNDQGKYISYTGGPAFGGMMGGRLACVSCHGEDGRGGLHWMHMQQVDAPDIRYSTLLNDHDEGEEEMSMDEYDLDTFRKAVVLGQHPDGDTLSIDMPRWQMGDQDLSDLFEYINSLP
jgi:cytochrome c oxidase subunit 2